MGILHFNNNILYIEDGSLLSYNYDAMNDKAYYPFELDMLDYTNNYDFEPYMPDSSVYYAEGLIGNAIVFPLRKATVWGYDDVYGIKNYQINDDVFSGRKPWTISLWYNYQGPAYNSPEIDPSNGYSRLFKTNTTEATGETVLDIALFDHWNPNPNGTRLTLRRAIIAGTTDASSYILDPSDYIGWHNLIVTYDGTTQRLYFDNLFKVSFTSSVELDTSTDFVIGSGRYPIGGIGQGDVFNGYIDQMRIFNRVITEIERNDIWNGGLGS